MINNNKVFSIFLNKLMVLFLFILVSYYMIFHLYKNTYLLIFFIIVFFMIMIITFIQLIEDYVNNNNLIIIYTIFICFIFIIFIINKNNNVLINIKTFTKLNLIDTQHILYAFPKFNFLS